MSHNNLLKMGWDYFFNPGPLPLEQENASRAVFLQYQTYPENVVQGHGTLVLGAPGGLPGSHFAATQNPQVYQNLAQIEADLLGGGVLHGIIATQPLIDTTSSV